VHEIERRVRGNFLENGLLPEFFESVSLLLFYFCFDWMPVITENRLNNVGSSRRLIKAKSRWKTDEKESLFSTRLQGKRKLETFFESRLLEIGIILLTKLTGSSFSIDRILCLPFVLSFCSRQLNK